MKNINAHISQRRIKLGRGYKRRPELRNCSALETGLELPSVKNKRVCVSFTLIWCLRGICCIPSLIVGDYRSEFSPQCVVIKFLSIFILRISFYLFTSLSLYFKYGDTDKQQSGELLKLLFLENIAFTSKYMGAKLSTKIVPFYVLWHKTVKSYKWGVQGVK